jgi:hypothetical protein
VIQSGIVELQRGEYVALLTDGITGDEPDFQLSRWEIFDAFLEGSPEEIARCLVEVKAIKIDDKTAIVVQVN